MASSSTRAPHTSPVKLYSSQLTPSKSTPREKAEAATRFVQFKIFLVNLEVETNDTGCLREAYLVSLRRHGKSFVTSPVPVLQRNQNYLAVIDQSFLLPVTMHYHNDTVRAKYAVLTVQHCDRDRIDDASYAFDAEVYLPLHDFFLDRNKRLMEPKDMSYSFAVRDRTYRLNLHIAMKEISSDMKGNILTPQKSTQVFDPDTLENISFTNLNSMKLNGYDTSKLGELITEAHGLISTEEETKKQEEDKGSVEANTDSNTEISAPVKTIYSKLDMEREVEEQVRLYMLNKRKIEQATSIQPFSTSDDSTVSNEEPFLPKPIANKSTQSMTLRWLILVILLVVIIVLVPLKGGRPLELLERIIHPKVFKPLAKPHPLDSYVRSEATHRKEQSSELHEQHQKQREGGFEQPSLEKENSGQASSKQKLLIDSEHDKRHFMRFLRALSRFLNRINPFRAIGSLVKRISDKMAIVTTGRKSESDAVEL